jgi:predicted HTH domain antitoxin
MSDGQSALENSKSVSFSDAARFLGVDVFTFYSMVQREEIPSFPGLWGESVVSQDDLDKLIAGKNALC